MTSRQPMGSGERLFVGLLGALLLGSGLYAVLAGAAPPVWRYPGGALLAVLGGNAVWGAFTGTRPWISRIGPLP